MRANAVRVERMSVLGGGRALPLVVAAVVGLASAARASEPHLDCPGNPEVEAWVSATVVAIDPRTTRCTVLPGTGPALKGETCIEPGGSFCFAPFELIVDGAASSASEPRCGLSPGRHTLSLCGVRCGEVALSAGSIPVRVSTAEPQLTVRVDRVFVGSPDLVGTDVSGELRDLLYTGDQNIDRETYLRGALSPGTPIEVSWPPGEVPQFIWEVPRCSYQRRHPSPPPGCTRCDSGGSAPVAPALLLALVVVGLRRRRIPTRRTPHRYRRFTIAREASRS
jgi:uncharacterized protein (TIGR03382 family)